MHHMDADHTHGEKARQELYKNATSYTEQILEAQNNTYLLSLKPSKQDKQGMRDTAGEARTYSKVMFSYGPLDMDLPLLVDMQELTYDSSVQTQNAV